MNNEQCLKKNNFRQRHLSDVTEKVAGVSMWCEVSILSENPCEWLSDNNKGTIYCDKSDWIGDVHWRPFSTAKFVKQNRILTDN